MPLVDGDRPAEGDVWFRVLTSSNHSARGRVNHGAFKGSFMGAAQAGRIWDAEASGRLRSLAGSKHDAHQHALQYCKNHNSNFNGYMIPDPDKPAIEGLLVENIRLGVRYTPIVGGDTAHADLTFTGTIPADKSPEQKQLLLALPDLFVAVHESQWTLLPDATVNPSAPQQSTTPPTPQFPVLLLTYIKRIRDFIFFRK